MAGVGEEELEYESDPEEAKLLLKMRRREASDDEGEDEPRSRRPDSRAGIDSDYDSDGQGAAAEYEEDESEVEEEDEEELNGYVTTSEAADEYREDKLIEVQKMNQLGSEEAKKENEEFVEGEGEDDADQVQNEDGEKKENEPFAVPTAGAFYMHDDRFRDSAGGRNRRTLGGRKLWESKDNKKWGHDKFEELTMEDPNYDNRGRRAPRGGGRYRGRGKPRNENRGYPQEAKSADAYNNSRQNNVPAKNVRGRGPRKYQPASQNYRQAPTQNRQPGQSVTVSVAPTSSSKVESNQVSSRKNTFASSLNSASPPFYPSKETSSNAQTKVRGKNVAGNSISMDKLYIDDSIPIPSGKPLTNMEMPPPLSSLMNATNNNYSSGYQHNNNQHRQTSQTRFQQVSRSPPKSVDSGEVESPPRSGSMVVKGRNNVGRSVMSYSGASGGGSGSDQNFPATPAFLPMMQFGPQHSGGMGVPAVGMAFPGYVAQPQLGLGKSEMTWLPVLASAAGAMGATYCSPYLAVDGAATSAYQPVSGQTSSLAAISSKENNASKNGNELKPSQRFEVTNDEFGQRQNKPRRYTEMKFDQ